MSYGRVTLKEMEIQNIHPNSFRNSILSVLVLILCLKNGSFKNATGVRNLPEKSNNSNHKTTSWISKLFNLSL
jgi:hypothetical protein